MAKTSKSKSKTRKLTPFEEELVLSMKKVKEYKLSCEANIVSIFYKNIENMYICEMRLDDFTNNIWKVYYAIAYDVLIKEKKQTLDEITIGLYLEKHPKLKEKYEEYGGYETIENAKKYVNESNLDGYMVELKKWNVVINLIKMKFPVGDRLADFVDMTSEEIYDEFEAKLNHLFANVDGGVKSYNIADGIDETIENLDKGMAVGMPYNNVPMINKEIGGMLLGTVTLIGALSNTGKSSFVRNTVLPSIINENEKIVVILNEEDLIKWQREFLVWTANNILKKDLQKYIVRDGKYTQEVKDILHSSAEWIKKQKDDKRITIIPFQRYTTAQAIKSIKKYSSLGVNYFIIDTFKNDAGSKSQQVWQDLAQHMVDLNDTVKPSGKNVHLIATFQLEKGKGSRQRFYSQDNTGVSKSIIDPVATCIMIRNFFDDELDGGKNELKTYRLEGVNKRTKIPVKLDSNKNYQVVFIVKSREGDKSTQFVIEHDLSRNIVKEIGITRVPVDF